MPQRTTIIWDWNGTLLDDAEICLEAINIMLKKRHLPELSMERYRDVFTFPVIEYYREVGFDFTLEAWDPVATEFGFIPQRITKMQADSFCSRNPRVVQAERIPPGHNFSHAAR